MSKLIFFTLILLTVSCQKKEKKMNKPVPKVISLQQKTKASATPSLNTNDFSEFEKKEEKCDSEEEQLKKEFEKNKSGNSATIQLQGGGTTGCKVN